MEKIKSVRLKKDWQTFNEFAPKGTELQYNYIYDVFELSPKMRKEVNTRTYQFKSTLIDSDWFEVEYESEDFDGSGITRKTDWINRLADWCDEKHKNSPSGRHYVYTFFNEYYNKDCLSVRGLCEIGWEYKLALELNSYDSANEFIKEISKTKNKVYYDFLVNKLKSGRL